MANNKSISITGSILALIHLILVLLVYWAVAHHNNPNAPFGWLLLAFVDFPVSLGMGIRALQIDGNYIWNNATLPGLYFGILGTAWWYFIGFAISRLAAKIIKYFRVQKGAD